MEGTYDVFYEGEKVGNLHLQRNGLYYIINAECMVEQQGMFQLVMNLTDRSEEIGLMMPDKGRLILKKRIPVKRVGECLPYFSIKERNPCKEEVAVIRPEQPFIFLHRLQEAYLDFGENGCIIRFKKTVEKKKNRG